jgi:hypothetical protein
MVLMDGFWAVNRSLSLGCDIVNEDLSTIDYDRVSPLIEAALLSGLPAIRAISLNFWPLLVLVS